MAILVSNRNRPDYVHNLLHRLYTGGSVYKVLDWHKKHQHEKVKPRRTFREFSFGKKSEVVVDRVW